MSARRLVVMRHAKAEPYATTDHVRQLTDRGTRSAEVAGAYLADLGAVPDHAVVSTATRTRMTWDALARAAGCGDVAHFDDAVYTGGVEVVLEVLRHVPDDAATVLYVGHNPAAAYLAHLLDDGEGDPEAIGGLLRGFPTSALVVFEISVPWDELAAETGRVVAFHAPGS